MWKRHEIYIFLFGKPDEIAYLERLSVDDGMTQTYILHQ
jgi:hypothetical protein